MKRHIAMYGSTRMERGYCAKCKQYAIVIKNVLQCCDAEFVADGLAKKAKRMIEAYQKRQRPSRTAIQKMLQAQDNKCFYCEIPFGTAYMHPQQKIIRVLKVCCDHVIPYKLTQDNRDINFVCACGTCNGIKLDLVFQTIQEAKDFINYKRIKKGFTDEIYLN